MLKKVKERHGPEHSLPATGYTHLLYYISPTLRALSLLCIPTQYVLFPHIYPDYFCGWLAAVEPVRANTPSRPVTLVEVVDSQQKGHTSTPDHSGQTVLSTGFASFPFFFPTS